MLKAEQNTLLQRTNQSIIDIRQLQIQYYSEIYVALGTQAALIAGFANFVLPAVQPFYSFNGYDLFAMCSAISQLFAIHVILSGMFLNILGRGMALNGPGMMCDCKIHVNRTDCILVTSV